MASRRYRSSRPGASRQSCHGDQRLRLLPDFFRPEDRRRFEPLRPATAVLPMVPSDRLVPRTIACERLDTADAALRRPAFPVNIATRELRIQSSIAAPMTTTSVMTTTITTSDKECDPLLDG